MEEFGVAKEEWFGRYLELPNGIPSHDTCNRVCRLLAPLAFQECLFRWTQRMGRNLHLVCGFVLLIRVWFLLGKGYADTPRCFVAVIPAPGHFPL
jgi:hypothetical protein